MAIDEDKVGIRQPPSDEEPDPEEMEAFIEGDDSQKSKNSDVQNSEDSEEQTSERVQTTVYLDADVKKRLKVHCALEDEEMSATVTEAVEQYLEDNATEP